MSKLHLNAISLWMAFTLLCTGCFTFNQVGTPGETPIEITNSESKTAVAHFDKSRKVHHFLWGLVSPDNAGVEQLISDEVKANGGSRAVNIKMKYQSTFVDGLLNIITFGIYTPFTLKVEGDVVR